MPGGVDIGVGRSGQRIARATEQLDRVPARRFAAGRFDQPGRVQPALGAALQVLAQRMLRIGGHGEADPGTASTAVRGRGSWRLLFANVDDELSLFVDGRPVECSGATTWTRPMPEGPTAVAAVPVAPGDDAASDLAPVGVRVANADVRVEGLRILRDIYYIGAVDVDRSNMVIEEDVLEFPLGADEFFMLGDNSAASKDSRLWLTGHHVHRRLLIGRALAVWWPHMVPASWSVPLRFRGQDLRLPCWPNFGRMRFVR